jgi:hypothetical protein
VRAHLTLQGRAKSTLERMIFSFEEAVVTEAQVEGVVEEEAIALDEVVFVVFAKMSKMEMVW